MYKRSAKRILVLVPLAYMLLFLLTLPSHVLVYKAGRIITLPSKEVINLNRRYVNRAEKINNSIIQLEIEWEPENTKSRVRTRAYDTIAKLLKENREIDRVGVDIVRDGKRYGYIETKRKDFVNLQMNKYSPPAIEVWFINR